MRTNLHLVMHRIEARKTTNSGRLAMLCLQGSAQSIHGDRAHPAQCPDLTGRRPLLLFPSEDAAVLTGEHGGIEPVTLFVPDGTWRQAAKMPKRISWLNDVPHVKLPEGPVTGYQLRNETRDGGLATLEAIARAIGILEGPAVQREMERVFRIMVERTLWSRGGVDRAGVFGGIPPHASLDDAGERAPKSAE